MNVANIIKQNELLKTISAANFVEHITYKNCDANTSIKRHLHFILLRGWFGGSKEIFPPQQNIYKIWQEKLS